MGRGVKAPDEPDNQRPQPVEVVGTIGVVIPVRVEGPIPVDPPTSDQWIARTLQVETAVVEVAGVQRKRARLTVRNVGADSVYIGQDRSIGPGGHGFQLPAGDELELRHTGAVYAVCATGEDTTVAVSIEHNR